MARIKLALAWLRRWGAWLLTGALFILAAFLYLALRAARRRAAADALLDRAEAIDRAGLVGYERARSEYAAAQAAEHEREVERSRRAMAAAEHERKVADAKVDEMDDASEVAAEFRRRRLLDVDPGE